MPEGNGNPCLEAAGAGRHHIKGVSEKNPFFHVVGHENNRFFRLLPDPHQQLLHQSPGLGVQGAEGCVHQKDLRICREVFLKVESFNNRVSVRAGSPLQLLVLCGSEPVW
ncbi:MAG: hypothetical protein HPY58_04265 [Firmicutes bacterium]|nr:hypothetical protein [Bacillota bacterium]